MKPYETVCEAIYDLKARGFAEEFSVSEEGVRCLGLGRSFTPDQLEIEEYHRFEGMSYPGDNEIVYALRAKDDSVRGVLVCPFGGAYADSATGRFMAQLTIRPEVSRAA